MARVNTSGPSKSGIQNSSYTYAADAQASDAYAITVSPAPSAYAAGQSFLFKANTANTGGASLNVNSLGAKTILKSTDQALATGDIEVGSIVEVVYDGASFQMVSVSAATPATGDVAGPASSVDNELPLFSGTGGKTLKRSTGTGVVRVDSGVVSIDSDVTDLVSAASDSAAGKVELAITSEVDTGTDATRAVTPDALAGSNLGTKSVVIVPFGSGDAVAIGDGTLAFTIPASMNGMNLVNVVASVHTKGITGTTDVQIRARTGGVDSDMLLTKITLGDEFFVSDEVVDTANDDVATGDQIYVDVDAVHSGTAPNGLSVALEFRLP